MKQQDVLKALAALAQESRLAVFRLLVSRGPDGYTPGEMSELLGIPAPTLSFHLKELTEAGLLSVRKRSRFLHYQARFDRMSELLAYLTENCCSLGNACDAACAPTGPKSAGAASRRARRTKATTPTQTRDRPNA
jgi:ArsR family transcriptional regulator